LITLHIVSQQRGGHITYEYHAEENESSTPAEVAATDEIVNAVIKHMADKGMTGQAVKKVPKRQSYDRN
jgi:polygalacturonase